MTTTKEPAVSRRGGRRPQLHGDERPAGRGKTTTTANLPIKLADAGQKVLLIEAELRRLEVREYLGVETAVGTTDVLIHRVELDDALQPRGRNGLTVLAPGAIPPKHSEPLGSTARRELLGRFDATTIAPIGTPYPCARRPVCSRAPRRRRVQPVCRAPSRSWSRRPAPSAATHPGRPTRQTM